MSIEDVTKLMVDAWDEAILEESVNWVHIGSSCARNQILPVCGLRTSSERLRKSSNFRWEADEIHGARSLLEDLADWDDDDPRTSPVNRATLLVAASVDGFRLQDQQSLAKYTEILSSLLNNTLKVTTLGVDRFMLVVVSKQVINPCTTKGGK